MWLEFRAPIEMYRNVSPVVRPLPSDVVFRRFSQFFYPFFSKSHMALELAKSLEKLRPYADKRIAGLKDQVESKGMKDLIANIQGRALKKSTLLNSQKAELAHLVATVDFNQDSAGALAKLKEMEKTQPHNAVIQRILGGVTFGQKNYNLAKKHYTQALALNPYDYMATTELGILYAQEKKTKEAEAFFRSAIEMNPYFEHSWANLIVLLNQMGRSSEVHETIKKAKPYGRDWDIRLPNPVLQ